MGQYKIRLGSVLCFDEETEGDLIEIIEGLSEKHKLGQYISNLLRISLETPEMMVFKDKNEEIHFSNYMQDLNRLGITPKRLERFDKIDKEISKIDEKINKLYDLCLEIKTMAKFGKRMGLERKIDNILLADFMVGRELKRVKDSIGYVQSKPLEENREKIDLTDEKAEKYLEYIIETYGEYVDAIKEVHQDRARYVEKEDEQPEVEKVDSVLQEEQIKEVEEQIKEVEEQIEEVEEVEEVEEPLDDEIIDFGKADIGALRNFFGQ